MKLYELLKSYKEKGTMKAIIHTTEDEKFTIYSDAVEYLSFGVNQSNVVDWKIIGRQSIEIWLEKAIPSG